MTAGRGRLHPTSEAGFGGDVSAYERGRPSYPADAVAWIVDGFAIGPGRDVVDLAAGTGKLTRLLLPTGANLTAVEPSASMRAAFADAVPGVAIVDGTAEALPFADASVDVVTAAQAFHWFDLAAATAELDRVLRPGGGVALVWNERDVRVPWVAEMNTIFGWDRREEFGVPLHVERDWAAEFAAAAPARLRRLERFETTWRHRVDVDTLVQRVLSTSYLASGAASERERVEAEVRELAARFEPEFDLPYVTIAYRTV